MVETKKESILFIKDEGVTQEENARLLVLEGSIKRHYTVEILEGFKLTEDLLHNRLEQRRFDLVLIPRHTYLSLKSNRSNFVGYHCAPLLGPPLAIPIARKRQIILDFARLNVNEILVMIKSLIRKQTRTVSRSHPDADPESIIEAFQKRYFEARFQMRQFELELEKIKQHSPGPEDIETLKLKILALINREKAWTQELLFTLEREKPNRRRTKKSK